MARFETKKEVDEWYKSAVDGIGRSVATDLKRELDQSPFYQPTVRTLNEIKKHLYGNLSIEGKVELIGFHDTVENNKD